MAHSFPYHGEDFCLIHGREHMRFQMGNPIPWCAACEEERDDLEHLDGMLDDRARES